MALLGIITLLIGLYLSWRTIKLLRAIAKELKIQEDQGMEKKWLDAVKQAMKDKVYNDK